MNKVELEKMLMGKEKSPSLNCVAHAFDDYHAEDITKPFKTFFPNKCHVCHVLDNPKKPLKTCGSCKLVSYCGRIHQVQDWKDHMDICKLIKKHGGPKMFEKLKELRDPENASMEEKFWLSIERMECKRMYYLRVTEELNRPPFYFESDMFLHPRVCIVCFENNPSLLKSCPNCPQATFCNKHTADPEHAKVCHLFKRCLDIELAHPKLVGLFQKEVRQLKSIKFPFQNIDTKLPGSMEDFVKSSSCIQMNRTMKQKEIIPDNLWEIHLTNAISAVLTTLYALEKLKFPVSSNLKIHVVGACRREIGETLWELISHWLPVVRHVKIFFIGPDAKDFAGSTIESLVCTSCRRRKKEITFHIDNKLYQDFMVGKTFEKPDIIIAFNAGLHAYSSWMPAIEKMSNLHCPFIYTSYTDLESYRSYEKIKHSLPQTKCLHHGFNPFASFHTDRNADNEKIFKLNDYISFLKLG